MAPSAPTPSRDSPDIGNTRRQLRNCHAGRGQELHRELLCPVREWLRHGNHEYRGEREECHDELTTEYAREAHTEHQDGVPEDKVDDGGCVETGLKIFADLFTFYEGSLQAVTTGAADRRQAQDLTDEGAEECRVEHDQSEATSRPQVASGMTSETQKSRPP